MLRATTRLDHGAAPDAMGRFAADHPDIFAGEGPWRMDLPLGGLEVRPDDRGLDVAAWGISVVGLSYMKLIFVDHIREYMGEEVELIWEGDGQDHGIPPFFREVRVRASRRLTPSMQRVTLAVPDLASLPVEEIHVRLLLPPEGRGHDLPPAWPMLTPSGSLSWPGGADALLVRVYTLRRVDVARGEVEIDFVLHDAEGPEPAAERTAAAWAVRCQPGDIAGMLGPGGNPLPPARRVMIVGDETALPAIARYLEALPEGTEAETIIEVDGPDCEQALARPVRWLHRNGAAPGTTRLLADAVAEREACDGLYFWAGCEFSAFRDIRRHVRSVWKLPRDRHLVIPYWRRGQAGEMAEEPHHTRA